MQYLYNSLLSGLAILFLTQAVSSVSADLPKIALQISGNQLFAEVANTSDTRAKGLMFRESLDENSGMLFVFPKSGYHGMWMKNTVLPLSIAFIDDKGVIVNIADMQPQSRYPHYPVNPIKYALEMNVGWFAQRKIFAGDRIIGLENIPQAN